MSLLFLIKLIIVACTVGFYRNTVVSLCFKYPRFDQTESYVITDATAMYLITATAAYVAYRTNK